MAIRQQFPSESHVKVYTFNSARKMMSTIIKSKNENDEITGLRLHTKGASEIVLAKCSQYLGPSGEKVELDQAKINEIIGTVVEPMASNGLRTICVAYRDLSSDMTLDSDKDESEVIKDLTCLCLVGIEDPVRAEVPEAIKKCQKGGVVVRMVTGDNVNTATSIALKCGIISPGDDFLVLESAEFNKRIKDENGEVDQALFDKVCISSYNKLFTKTRNYKNMLTSKKFTKSLVKQDRNIIAFHIVLKHSFFLLLI